VGRNTIGPWSHPWWDSGESPSSYLPLSTNHGKGSIVTSYKVDPRPRVGSKTCPLQARRFRTARSPHPRTAFQPASPSRSPSTCSTASDSATKTSATNPGAARHQALDDLDLAARSGGAAPPTILVANGTFSTSTPSRTMRVGQPGPGCRRLVAVRPPRASRCGRRPSSVREPDDVPLIRRAWLHRFVGIRQLRLVQRVAFRVTGRVRSCHGPRPDRARPLALAKRPSAEPGGRENADHTSLNAAEPIPKPALNRSRLTTVRRGVTLTICSGFGRGRSRRTTSRQYQLHNARSAVCQSHKADEESMGSRFTGSISVTSMAFTSSATGKRGTK
jgi:hypothetical protein